MAYTLSDLKLFFRALLGGTNATPDEATALVNAVWEQNQPIILEVATDADGDFTVRYKYMTDKDITVTAVYFLTEGTLTANGTNYTTLKLNKYDGAGGSATLVASRATDTVSTDDVAAGVPYALTVSVVAGAADLDAGEVLGIEGTKTLLGVAVPAGVLIVEYVPR